MCPALWPALALVVGSAVGLHVRVGAGAAIGVVVTLAATAAVLWWHGRSGAARVVVAVTCAIGGTVHASHARATALHTPLRAMLEARAPGFAIDTLGPPAAIDPVLTRIVLAEDASPSADITTLRAHATALWLDGAWRSTSGGVIVSVGGAAATRGAEPWVAGRVLELPLAFRRPARFLNDGVPDFEADLALDGTTLFASAKSGLLVAVAGRGTAVQEAAARIRAHVRGASSAWVGVHDPLSAAIVTAVLIGDRTGLPDAVRLRLQAAGTYHVIAISGGNIAILAAICLALLRLAGVAGRPAALLALVTLVGYAQVVTAGPSVWRATMMASLYLAARVLDHRTPPWNAVAVTAAAVVFVQPLDVRDVGFLLTFGATIALIGVARRVQDWRVPRVARWTVGSLAASIATEAALLPVSAHAFSRVTSAGLVLNLLAVPLMGVVQVAGIVVSACEALPLVAAPAGAAAHLAARALVESARLVDVWPWLSARVPPPSLALLLTYYAALAVAVVGRRYVRVAGAVVLVVAAALIGGPGTPLTPVRHGEAPLRLTVFDVGQSESLLLQAGGGTLLVDAGGAPFGSSGFDIGARVLAPALWARGVRRLDALLVTHGDPDHLGGAPAVLGDFSPAALLEGVRVPRHAPFAALLEQARTHGVASRPVVAGRTFAVGAAQIRVLHPPPADWERQRVRNDDSVVLDVRYGDVALLLTGDITASVERAIAPRLRPARIRVLKVAHHGSRTSSSQELLDAWRPQVALISAGRANTFGHPAADVVQRLQSRGVRVYRTDRHGQITVETDGRTLGVRTYEVSGRRQP